MGTVPVAQNGAAGYKLRPDQQIHSKPFPKRVRVEYGAMLRDSSRGDLEAACFRAHVKNTQCLVYPDLSIYIQPASGRNIS